MQVKFTVDTEQDGERIDRVLVRWLSDLADADESLLQVPTRTKIAHWIASGQVAVDGEQCTKPSYRVRSQEEISLEIPAVLPLEIEPDAEITIDVLHEDSDLLVLNKPAGLTVHPGAGQHDKTLVNGLLAHLGPEFGVGGESRPGLVHRLDKDTSGVMVVAKTDFAYQHMVQQFCPPRSVNRMYLAVTRRIPRTKNAATAGTIDLPIGRHPANRKKMAVLAAGGKSAVSHWELLDTFPNGVLLTVRLDTGRTHQIRVHLAHLQAPIIGDPVYGEPLTAFPPQLRGAVKKLGRQALHAHRLEFIHPRTGVRVGYEAPMPADMEVLIASIKGPNPTGS